MSVEYGIFEDGHLVESQFRSPESAERALRTYVEVGEDVPRSLYVSACCADHPEHEAISCEECFAEDDT